MSRLALTARRRPVISPADRDAIAATAAAIRARQPGLGAIDAFGPRVGAGLGEGAAILIGDNGEIPLIKERGGHRLDYRIGFLAEAEDLLVIGGPTVPEFEAALCRALGLPRLARLNADPGETPPRRAVPAICLRDGAVFDALCRHAAGRDEVTLIPCISTGRIWALAARLAACSGARALVAGPPPRLSRAVNDKGWFGAAAMALLGPQAAPPKRIAHNAVTLTRHVATLARRWDRLFLKLPDSAGSAGNYVLDAAPLRGLGAAALHDHLRGFLRDGGWPGLFPLVVEVMDANVLTSPSVQTWIPAPADGPPVIEGVFEQALSGAEGMFIGAAPARLPGRLDAALCREAMQMALLFQHLGWFGRCSFDAVALGRDLASARHHWIECNGRWGGVSIPMTFANRVAEGGADRPYVIVQAGEMSLPPRSFAEALAAAADLGAPEGDVVFLSPNAVMAGTGCHALCFGDTADRAQALSEALLRRLSRPG